MRLAAKRLSLVEVSADASHQHEFNAGLLRTSLGLPADKVTGQIEFTYTGGQQSEPTGELCSYSLYDARAGKPRAAEFRLYFASTQLQELARPGDILILIRPDESFRLKGLVVAADSLLGKTLSTILGAEGTELDNRFRQIKAAIKSTELAHLLAEVAEPLESIASADLVQFADGDFLLSAIQLGTLPDTKAMAEQAAQIVRRAGVADNDPDEMLDALLLAETGLFRYLEQEIGQKALDALAAGGRLDFDAAVELVMRRLQSRKSRRGQSLQNHFAAILTQRGIRFASPCRTEGGEQPDFMIPGCKEYHDLTYPADRLRMVACKSTIKERWGQILKEADRIPEKYVLTLDSRLTDDLILRMTQNQLVVFLPKRVRDEVYSHRTSGELLGNVSELLDRLAAVS